MKKIRSILWGIRTGFLYCPVMFFCFFSLIIIRSTIVVSSTVLLGDIISDVVSVIESGGSFDVIVQKLIIFGLLEIVLWILVELYWRFNDDILPMRANVGFTKKLVNFSRNIPLKSYDKKEFCDEYERYRDGIENLTGFVKNTLKFTDDIYRMMLVVITLWQFNPIFSAILACFVVINYFAVKNIPEIQNDARLSETEFKRQINYLDKMFFGISNRETRLYGLKNDYIEKWLKNKEKLCEIEIEVSRQTQKSSGLPEFLRDGVCPMIVISIAIVLTFMKKLAVGSIYTAWNLTTMTLSNASAIVDRIVDIFSTAKQIEETFNFETQVLNEVGIVNSEKLDANLKFPAISVENVSFSYLKDRQILKDISFQINKGETVALLGANGCGKSTLIKLILGLYTPEFGQVKIFGNDPYLQHEYISEHVGAAFQDFCKYPFTLRENISFGSLDKLDDDKALEEAIIKSQGENILSKVGTFDRILGREIDPNGVELSGGEWQRLALARAYLGNKDIMIFDEPAAKLDPLAEIKQFENIRSFAKDKAVILVSHRVGFARLADRIVVLKDGKISEIGTHEELYAKRGEYYSMFTTQKELYTAKDEVK